jgi:type II secretory pathway pseudopilin PulG
MRRADANRRGGFTLVEMLVVIFIIILLVGLLLPAVQKARDSATRARCKNEIAGLGTAIENFKATYDVKYVPSAFVLSNNYNNPPANGGPAYVESRDFFSKVWPKASQNGVTNTPQPIGFDAPNGSAVFLDGNQTLVFFLGGIPAANNKFSPGWAGDRSGFLNSAQNPFNIPAATPFGMAQPVPAANLAKGNFFDFDPKRVNADGHFLDVYGQPYYYFSSKFGNDYDRWGIFRPILNPGNTPGGFTDMGGYGWMNPHVGIDGKFVNPSGYQIVSAGKDQTPSAGGQLLSANPRTFDPNFVWPGSGSYKVSRTFPVATSYDPTGGGADDLANFSTYVLSSDK